MEERKRNRLLLIILLALFALAGLARLNPFCLLEPDIPGYLFTSHSLASLDGYRDIDSPGEPRHSFRPPGLPLLLAPLSLVSPYNVQAAKILVLVSTLLAFALMWSYARKLCGDGAALLALLLIVSSPFTLLFATEVMSEFPYLACMFAILLLLRRGAEREDWRTIALVALPLAFLPFIRTIGLVWIAAIGLWGLVSRPRWRWSLAAALALVPTLLWSWRNGLAGGPTYLAAIARDLTGTAPSEVLRKIGSGAWYYLGAFFELLLPALEPGRPLYERVLLAPAPDLGGLFGLGALPALVLTLLFLLGLLVRRKEEGGLIALQALLLFAALAIYPPRHERLVWPLMALAWIYAAVGARFVIRRLQPAKWIALCGIALLCIWQAAACGLMISTNLSRLRLGDHFYSELAPPMYYSDWQAAGRWINSSTPQGARILTRHSDVGFTARRYQDSLRFEELSPAAWRHGISRFRARYLVVPTTLCGRMFPRHLLGNDPVYRYRTVYEARDVAVLEVLPNRTGTVALEAPGSGGDLERCLELSERLPERIDLLRRKAELLSRAGRTAEAEAVLREAIAAGVRDAGIHLSLGTVLESQERHREALEEFHFASSMPNAGLLKKRIARGVGRAKSAIAAGERGLRGAGAFVESARWKMGILDYARAREDADRALEIAPEDQAVQALHADLLRVVGKLDEPMEHATEEQSLQFAARWAGEGRPGKALAHLEQSLLIYPGSRMGKFMLADLYLFYGLVHESEAIYRELLDISPADEAASRGLRLSREAATLPSF